MTRKRRLLIHGDSVCKTSGFGHVVRTLVSALPEWDVVQIGLNHPGPTAKPPAGYEHVRVIDPRSVDDKQLGFSVLRELYLEEDFDLCFIMQDLHVAKVWAPSVRAMRDMRRFRNRPACPLLFHFPVDGPMLADHALIEAADASVVPTEHANDLLLDQGLIASRLPVIPHAFDPAYGPQDPEQRAELRARVFGLLDPDALAVLWLGVNSPRKDPFTALQAIKALSGRVQAKIHLHTAARFMGMDVYLMARAAGLDGLSFQVSDSAMLGLPAANVNDLYAAADCLLFTSRREGVGIPMIEAMAMKTPVVAPNYGPFAEILGHGNHGTLVAPPVLCWQQYDDRGPHYQSDPALIADALEALCIERKQDRAAYDARLDLAHRVATEKHDMAIVRTRWRRYVHDLLESAGRNP